MERDYSLSSQLAEEAEKEQYFIDEEDLGTSRLDNIIRDKGSLILEMYNKGLSDSQISRRTHTSHKTLKRIYNVLGMTSRVDLYDLLEEEENVAKTSCKPVRDPEEGRVPVYIRRGLTILSRPENVEKVKAKYGLTV